MCSSDLFIFLSHMYYHLTNTPFILDNLSHSSICKLGLKNPNQGYAVRILKGIIYLPFAKARRVLGFNTLNEIAEEYIRNVA